MKQPHHPLSDSSTPRIRPQSVLQFLALHYVETLTLLAVLFVAQTGLVPFDFRSTAHAADSTQFFGIRMDHLTLADIISNIFLYVPLGALVFLSLMRITRSIAVSWIVTLAVTFLLSFAIEWLQAYSASRVSSMIDLVSNVTGAILGASVAWLTRRLLPRLVRRGAMEWIARPHATMLKLYVVVLIIMAAVPFSLSFDATQLRKSIRSSVLIPFGRPYGSVSQAGDVEHLSKIAIEQQRWTDMKRWSRWTAEAVSFSVLAWLLLIVLQGQYGFDRRPSVGLTTWFGVSLAVMLSVIQLPIVTRTCDVTDILFRCLGLGLGVFVQVGSNRRDAPLSWGSVSSRRSLAHTGAVAVAIYICYTGLLPFTFEFHSDTNVAAISPKGFLPFFAYFLARFDLMMADVLEKFISYGLLTILLLTGSQRLCSATARIRLMHTLTICAGMSICIEIAQIFIPVRTTSLTDPIIACAGCGVGVLTHHWAVLLLRFARSAPKAEDKSGQISQWTPLDELVASLMDERDDAPREKPPAVPVRNAERQSV